MEAEALLVVDVGDQHGQGVGDDLQLGFAVAQGLFAEVLPGDVHHRAGKAQCPAGVVVVAAPAGEGPARFAAVAVQAIALGQFASAGDALLQRGAHAAMVIAMDVLEERLERESLAAAGQFELVDA
ncbi:hypothetical protein BAY1663_04367 [Pseudomonas sp. BAY1663]|nr:hypothetical protein BAY1663_04367 [Pseudomonas sp. BAY1663]